MQKKAFWTKKRATIVLAFVGAGWGLSYITMKVVMLEMTPIWMASLRFLLAFVAIACIFFRKIMKTSVKEIKGALVVGAFDAGIFVFLLNGLKFTTATNAGFLCSTSVVIVPILHAIIIKKKPEKRIFVCCIVAILGIGLMTIKQTLEFSIYDAWCLLSAFSYALWVLSTNHFAKKCDELLLGIWQLFFTAVYLLVIAALTEKPCFPTSQLGLINFFVMTLFCTSLCFVLQTVAQKHTTPEIASLMFCFEPISSAVLGHIFFNEVIEVQGYVGALLILVAVVFSSVKVNGKKRLRSA